MLWCSKKHIYFIPTLLLHLFWPKSPFRTWPVPQKPTVLRLWLVSWLILMWLVSSLKCLCGKCQALYPNASWSAENTAVATVTRASILPYQLEPNYPSGRFRYLVILLRKKKPGMQTRRLRLFRSRVVCDGWGIDFSLCDLAEPLHAQKALTQRWKGRNLKKPYGHIKYIIWHSII